MPGERTEPTSTTMLQRFKNFLSRKNASNPESPLLQNRYELACGFLKGKGLEVGPLHMPLPVPTGCEIAYVDRFSTDELRSHYPELADKNLTEPDIIDDGEALSDVPSSSQDFVVANHFLEHCQDPIGTVKAFVRVTNPGGILFLSIPDQRFGPDRNRPITTLEHLISDHESGPDQSRRHHYWEWATMVDGLDEETAQRQMAHYMKISYSIHFHCWTPETFDTFWEYLEKNLPLRRLQTQVAQQEIRTIAEVL